MTKNRRRWLFLMFMRRRTPSNEILIRLRFGVIKLIDFQCLCLLQHFQWHWKASELVSLTLGIMFYMANGWKINLLLFSGGKHNSPLINLIIILVGHLARAMEWDEEDQNELGELNNKYSVFSLFISIVAVMGSLLRNMSSYGYGFLGTRACCHLSVNVCSGYLLVWRDWLWLWYLGQW